MTEQENNAQFIGKNGVTYEVTGVDRNGKRFKICTDNHIHALGINLWKGTKWLVLPNGKRKILFRES